MELLAADGIIVLFKQYIPQQQKILDIKMYNLCNSLRFTYDMRAYTLQQRKNVTADLTPTKRGNICSLEEVQWMFVMNHTFLIREFTSPDLFTNL
jgi:hypothetical protein